jgi:SET domain-containing protein
MPRTSLAKPLPTASRPRLIVRSSSIHAAGCYTLEAIPKGRRVLEYDGPRISKETADERYADRPVTYLFGFLDHRDVIDGFGTGMFINHSCAPNCETEEVNGRIFIRTVRDIAAGEELLYEYNLYDSDSDDYDCYCGSAKCRGTMLSEDEVKRQARAKARKAMRKRAASAAI